MPFAAPETDIEPDVAAGGFTAPKSDWEDASPESAEPPVQSIAATAAYSFPKAFSNVATGTVGGIAKMADVGLDVVDKYTGIGKPEIFKTIGEVMDDASRNAAEMYPVDERNPLTATIAGGAAQGLSLLAGGAAGRAVGLGEAALTRIPLALGAAQGANQGIDTARELGVETPEAQLALGALFGGVEVATEKLGGIGNKAATDALIDQFKKPAADMLKDAAKAVVSEGVEEIAAGSAQDWLARAFATEDPSNPGFTKTGVPLPEVDPTTKEFLKKRGMEFIGGAAGGGVFAGAQVLANAGKPEAPVPSLESGESVVPEFDEDALNELDASVVQAAGIANRAEDADAQNTANELRTTTAAAMAVQPDIGTTPNVEGDLLTDFQINPSAAQAVRVAAGAANADAPLTAQALVDATAVAAAVQPPSPQQGVPSAAVPSLSATPAAGLSEEKVTGPAFSIAPADGVPESGQISSQTRDYEPGSEDPKEIPPQTPEEQPSTEERPGGEIETVGEVADGGPNGSNPIRENGARTALILPDGTALVGGRTHIDTWKTGVENGLTTDDVVRKSTAGFAKADGTAWDLQGNPIKIKKLVNLPPKNKPSTGPSKNVLTDASTPVTGGGMSTKTQENADIPSDKETRREIVDLVRKKHKRTDEDEARLIELGKSHPQYIRGIINIERVDGLGDTDMMTGASLDKGESRNDAKHSASDQRVLRAIKGGGMEATTPQRDATKPEQMTREAFTAKFGDPFTDEDKSTLVAAFRSPEYGIMAAREHAFLTTLGYDAKKNPDTAGFWFHPDPKIGQGVESKNAPTQVEGGTFISLRALDAAKGDVYAAMQEQSNNPVPEKMTSKEKKEYLAGFNNGKADQGEIVGALPGTLDSLVRDSMRKAANAASDDRPMIRLYWKGWVEGRVDSLKPILAAAVETYGIKLPEGYVKQGDLYVFQPQTKQAAETQTSGVATERDLTKPKPLTDKELPSLDQRGITESGREIEARFSPTERMEPLSTPDEQRNLREAQSGLAYGKAVRGEPLTQREVDSLPVRLPEGYVKQGDVYIYKPGATGETPVQAAPSAAQAAKATAPGPSQTTATEDMVPPGGVATQRDASKPEQMSPMPGILPGGSKPVPMAPTAKYNEALGHLRKLLPNTSLRWMQEVHFQVAEGIDPAVAAKDAFAQASSHDAARQAVKAALDSKEIESGPQAQDLYAKVYDATYKPTTPQTPTPQPPQASAVQAAAETGVVEARSEEGGERETVLELPKIEEPKTKQPKPKQPKPSESRIAKLVEEYNASGRVAFRYPRKGTISIDGTTLSEADAVSKMERVLAPAKPSAAPAPAKVESGGGAVTTDAPAPPVSSQTAVAASDIVPDNGKKASRGTPTTEPATFAASGGTVGEAGITQPPAAGGESGSAKVSKVYLNVPFTSKESAKTLGAKWDADEKLWYVLRREDGSVPPVPDRWLMDEGVALRDKEVLKAARINAEQKYGKPVEIAPVEMVSGTAYALRFTGGDWLNSNVSKEEARATKAAQPEKTEPAKPDSSAAFEIIKNAYPFKTTQTPSEERSFLKKVKDRLKPLGIAGWKIDSAVESIKLRRAQSGGGKLFYVDPTALHAELLRNGDVARKPEATTQQEEPSKPPDTRTIKQGDKVKFKQEGVLQSGTYQGVNADGTYSVLVKGEKVPRHVSARSLNENNGGAVVEGTRFSMPREPLTPEEEAAAISNKLGDFLAEKTGTRSGQWDGVLTNAEQKKLFGFPLVGKSTVRISGENQTIKAKRKVGFGQDADIQSIEFNEIFNQSRRGRDIFGRPTKTVVPAKQSDENTRLGNLGLVRPLSSEGVLKEDSDRGVSSGLGASSAESGSAQERLALPTGNRAMPLDKARAHVYNKLRASPRKVRVINEPSLKFRGRYDPDGTITLNSAYLGSVEELNDVLLNHESIHDAIETDDKVRKQADKLLGALTEDELADIEAEILDYKDGEFSAEQVQAERQVEAIRKLTANRPDLQSAWGRLVESVSLSFKKLLGVNVSRQQAELAAARIVARGLKRLRKGKTGGRTQGGGSLYGDAKNRNQVRQKYLDTASGFEGWENLTPRDRTKAANGFARRYFGRFFAGEALSILRIRRSETKGSGARPAAVVGRDGEITFDLDFDRNHRVLTGDSPEAAIQFVADITDEEMIHVAEMVGLRDQWIKAGRQGSFIDFMQDKNISLLDEMLDLSKGPLSQKIEDAILSSWNLYNQADTATSVAEVVQKLTDDLNKVTPFAAELVRQMIQINRTNLTTETGYQKILGVLKGWLEASLNALRSALPLIKSGSFGKLVKDRIAETEAVLTQMESGSSLYAASPSDVTRFKQLTSSIPPKPTPEQLETWKQEHPAEYKELEAMRERVLREMGYTVGPVYHGTTRKKVRFISPNKGIEVPGAAFLTDNEEMAEEYIFPREYGETVYEDEDGNEIEPGIIVKAMIRLNNPMTVDMDGEVGDTVVMSKAVREAKAAGNDGVVFENVLDGLADSDNEGTSYAVFESNQTKSLDPLATDDSGNLITPEAWGNETSPDIRYGPDANIPGNNETGGKPGASKLPGSSSTDTQGVSQQDNSQRANTIREGASRLQWGNSKRDERAKAVSVFARRVARDMLDRNPLPDWDIRFTSGAGAGANASINGYADGKITITFDTDPSPRMDLMGMDAELALAFAYDTIQEEAIHALQYVVAKNAWVKAGKPGTIQSFIVKRAAQATGDAIARYREAVSAGNTDLAAKIKEALLGSWNLYRAGENNPVFSIGELESRIAGKPVVATQYFAELTRQLAQLTRQDFTTETGWLKFKNMVLGWFQDAIDSLKAALPLARGGQLGPTIRQEISELETLMKNFENGTPKPLFSLAPNLNQRQNEPITGRERRGQAFGQPEIAQIHQQQSTEVARQAAQAVFNAAETPITPESRTTFLELMRTFLDPRLGPAAAQDLIEAGNDMAPVALQDEMATFALRAAAEGDVSLLNMFLNNVNRMSTGTDSNVSKSARELAMRRWAEATQLLGGLDGISEERDKTAIKSGVKTAEMQALQAELDAAKVKIEELLKALESKKAKGSGKNGIEVVDEVGKTRKKAAKVKAKKDSDEAEKSLEEITAQSIADQIANRLADPEVSAPFVNQKAKVINVVRELAKTYKGGNEEALLRQRLAELPIPADLQDELVKTLNANLEANKVIRSDAQPTQTAQAIVDGYVKRFMPNATAPQENRTKTRIEQALRMTAPTVTRQQVYDTLKKNLTELQIAEPLADSVARITADAWQVRRSAAIAEAVEKVSAKWLLQQVLKAPVEMQQSPNWRQDMMAQWLSLSGFTAREVALAVKVLDTPFGKALADVRIEAAERYAEQMRKVLGVDINGRARLRKAVIPAIERVQNALRAGSFEGVSDEMAKWQGWKPLSAAELKRLNELDSLIKSSPQRPYPGATPPHYVLKATHEMFDIFKQHVSGSALENMAIAFHLNLLSGLPTAGVNIISPPMKVLTEAAIDIARAGVTLDIARFQSIANALKTAASTYFKEGRFTAKYDISDRHGVTEITTTREIANLNYQLDKWLAGLKQAVKDKSPTGILKGVFGISDIVRRFLTIADTAGTAAVNAYSLIMGAHQMAKDAGVSTKNLRSMFTEARLEGQRAYSDAIMAGYSPEDADTAAIDAQRAAILGGVYEFVSPEKAFLLDRMAKQEGFLAIGRKPVADDLNTNYKGEETTDRTGENLEGGLISRHLFGVAGMNDVLEAISAFKYGGNTPKAKALRTVLGTLMYGLVHVPYRASRHFASYSPYGFIRYGVKKLRDHQGKENWHMQSMGTPEQERTALWRAAAGTALMALIASLFRGSDEPEEKDKDYITVTGNGPPTDDPQVRDAWIKQGNQPYHMRGRLFGVPFNVNIGRGGEVGLFAALPFAVADDLAIRDKIRGYKSKEYKASDIVDAFSTYVAAISQKGGAGGLIDLSGKHTSTLASGKGIASAVSGYAANVIPLNRFIQTTENLFINPPDKSTVETTITANIPLARLGNFPALNRMGDPVGDAGWLGKISYMGVPLPIDVEPTEQNKKVYEVIHSKMAAPGRMNRVDVEKKYGELTNRQWYDFVKASGGYLSKRITDSHDKLMKMSPGQVDDWMADVDKVARVRAANAGGLRVVKVTKAESP